MGVEQQFIDFATLLESYNQNGHGDIMGRNDSRSGFIGTTPRRGFTDLSGEPAIVKIEGNAVAKTAGTRVNGTVDGTAGTRVNGTVDGTAGTTGDGTVDGTTGTTGDGTVDGTTGTTDNGTDREFEVKPVISSKLGYNDWLASYGTDTDKMYNEGAGRLNYELQTWAAGYGARAEKLSQMGLSNSGVSDIYGANAYSTYVSAMNDLYLSKIEMDEANRRNYQEYSNKYDSDLNTAATEAYAYGLALYDGNNISTVETMMKNAGYSDEAVAVAVSRLTAVDASMLPVLKEQETKINEAFTTYMNSYTPANATAITNALTGGDGLTEEEAAKVIERLNEYYNSLPDDMKPDKVAENAKIEEALTWMSEQYNAGVYDLDTLQAQVGAIYGEDVAKAAREKFAQLVPKDGAGTVDPEILEAYNAHMEKYTKEMEASLRSQYKNIGWSQKKIDKLIEMLNSNIENSVQGAIDKTVKELNAVADVTPENVIMDTLIESLKSYEIQANMEEITTEQHAQLKESLSKAAVKAYEWAVKSTDNLEKAYKIFGFTQEEWSALGDAGREFEVMEKMAEYKSTGLISIEDYGNIVYNWAKRELNEYIRKGAGDARATVLQNAGSIFTQLHSWPLPSEKESEIEKYILDTIGLEMNYSEGSWQILKGENDGYWKMSWSKGEKGAEARMGIISSNFLQHEFPLTEEENKEVDSISAGAGLAAYNGKLYRNVQYGNKTYWHYVDPNCVSIDGDGVFNSSDQQIGIYYLIVKYFEEKQTNNLAIKNRDTRR